MQDGVLNLADFPADARERITSRYVRYPRRRAFPGHHIADSLAFSRSVLKSYLERPPGDFIYAKSFTSWAFLKAKRDGVTLPKIGLNAHGYEMFQHAPNLRGWLSNRLMRPFVRSMAKQADLVFSYGGRITDILKNQVGVRAECIVEIPGAVERNWIREEVVPVHVPVKFLFLGRYERRKGIEEIYQVFKNYPDSQRFSIDFVGPIPSEKQLRADGMNFRGLATHQGALLSRLDDCDVLICPSYSEGMPNVILEAMARGLAVIATDVGAISSLVGTENGILIAYPSARLIRQAMEKLVRLGTGALLKLKEASLRKVAEFTWDRIAEITIERISERLT